MAKNNLEMLPFTIGFLIEHPPLFLSKKLISKAIKLHNLNKKIN
jgi:hypothetical protein